MAVINSYAAGSLSRYSACAAAYYRGQLSGRLKANAETAGAMMAVSLSEDDIPCYTRTALGDEATAVHVACINSPSNCTLSGDESAIDALKRHLDAAGVFARKLSVGVAYHSSAMQAIACEYKERLDSILDANDATAGGGGGETATIPMVSSVTGHLVTPKSLRRGQYWVDNMTHPVQFCNAAQHLASLSDPAAVITDVVEIGPHATLRRPLIDSLQPLFATRPQAQPRYHAIMNRAESPARGVLKLAGQLFCLGHQISIAAANGQTNNEAIVPLTDVPRYPFNRSLRYWDESRLSRDSRLTGHAREEPLGVRSNDWNPLQPRWRNVLTLEALPWLKDHVVSETVAPLSNEYRITRQLSLTDNLQVNGTMVLPGTGSLVMAIQAVRQYASSELQTVGFLVKEADFLRPIIIDQADGKTETMLHLLPVRASVKKDTGLFDVEIYAYHDKRWTLCFTCTIKLVVNEQDADEVDGGKEQRLALEHMAACYQRTAETCTQEVDPRKLYRLMGSAGMQYGESFQLLRDTGWDGRSASTASIGILPSSQYSEKDFFHSTVIDAAVHSTVLQASKGAAEKMPAQVVHRMSNVWISAKPWHTPYVKLASRSRVTAGGRSNECALYVVDGDGEPLFSTESIVLTAVTRDKEPERSSMLYDIAWRPPLSLLSPDKLRRICGNDQAARQDRTRNVIFFNKIGPALMVSFRRAIRELTADDLSNCSPHIQKYLWALRRLTTPKYGHLEQTGTDIEVLLQEVEQDRPGWKLFATVARSLKPLITGQRNALEVFFQDRLAEMFYASMFDEVFDDRMRKFLDLATHDRPVRILEVGAGSGGMTGHILSMLGDLEKLEGRARFIDYTYTDISPAFFDDAKKRFCEFEGRMVFAKLDLESEALSAEFRAESYDIIFAGSVLHATSDLTATLARLRKLLRLGGKLAAFEIMPSFPWFEVVFGLLPGWWLSTEPWRASSPLVAEKKWAEVLRQTRFSGTDLIIKDSEDDAGHLFTMMISTAENPGPPIVSIPPSKFIIVVDPSSTVQACLAARLLDSCGVGEIISFTDVCSSNLPFSETIISLLEVDASVLPEISGEKFHALKQLIQRVSRMLWVASGCATDQRIAQSGMALGFFRALKSELPQKHIVTLIVESEANEPEAPSTTVPIVSYISQVLRAAFANGSDAAEMETEFAVRGGCLSIGRMLQAPTLSDNVKAFIVPSSRQEQWLPGRPVSLEVGIPGMLDTLRFIDDSVYAHSDLAADEVEIEAKAWPISFRDVVIALGRLDSHQALGLECAGQVTRVGTSCDHLQPGDRVVLLRSGSIRSYPRANVKAVVKIPDAWSYADAVSIANPGMTAYHALINLARLRKGEKILIHSASGSTGQMALHIAKMVGAEIFATVGYGSKKRVLTDRFGIPDDHIFYSRNGSFSQGVMRMTRGTGVDVILNSLSGQALRETWECIAPYGRFIEIGKVDIASNSSLPMAPIFS